MSTNFKENKLKITYEVPLEDINKKLKDDIVSIIRNYRSLWNILKRIFMGLFVGIASGVIFGGLFGAAGIFISAIVSAFSNNEVSIYHVLFVPNIFIVLLSVIIFGVFIYALIVEQVITKRLIQISAEVNYEEFFEEYNKEKTNFFMYDDLTENYNAFKSIMDCVDSLVKVDVHDSSLWITSTAENGDIEKTLVNVDRIVQNINIKEPEIRVGYDYKITYLEPYIS